MDPLAEQPRSDSRPIAPPGPSTAQRLAIGGGIVALMLAAGGWWWWRESRPKAPPPAPEAAAPAAPAPAASEAEAGAIRHPIEQAAVAGGDVAPEAAPADAEAALRKALAALVGNPALMAMLQTDGFAQRVVATVDNLDRSFAAPRLWPVVPSPGRFTTVRAGDGAEQIAPANATRYAPFVAFVESVDPLRAAALYVRWYPRFQQAYRELGYPQGYFNDRLVEVIDRLLATPEPAQPPAVRLTEVKGPIAPERPWVRYEYADPALEALPAGSKILLRMSAEQRQRLKTRLAAFRAAIVRAAPR